MPRAAPGIFARNWQKFGGLGENSKRAKMVAAERARRNDE
jgi:hypothetical protein